MSHDRAFLNNVVTSTLVLEGNGVIHEFPGGYDDWLAQRGPVAAPVRSKAKTTAVPDQELAAALKPRPVRKLTYKEERELARIPAVIEKLEAEQDKLFAVLSDVQFYKRDAKDIAQAKARLEVVERTFESFSALGIFGGGEGAGAKPSNKEDGGDGPVEADYEVVK